MTNRLVTKSKKTFFTLKNKKKAFIIGFLLPSIVLYSIIYLYPLINIFVTSFCKWDSTNLMNPKFLGIDHLFDNYIYLFTEHPYFKKALVNSLKWVGTGLFIQLPFAIIVALVLSQKLRGWRFTRNVFIIPNIISSAAIGLIFLNLYNPNFGIISLFGIDGNILINESSAFWAVACAYVFFGGSSSILILSQIFSISTDIFEAASIDGATNLDSMFHITLPLITPIIGTVAIIIANSSFLIYNEIEFITGGGPGGATFSLSYLIKYLSTGSSRLQFARANTVGVIQFIVGLLIVGFINLIFKTGKSND